MMGYFINSSSGALIGTGSYTTDGASHGIALGPSGKFAYVANLGNPAASIFTVHANTGILSPAGQASAENQPVSVDTTGTQK